jgi:hypothetical protein
MTKIKCDYYTRHIVKSKKGNYMTYTDKYCIYRDSKGYCTKEFIIIDMYKDGDTGAYIAECMNSNTNKERE